MSKFLLREQKQGININLDQSNNCCLYSFKSKDLTCITVINYLLLLSFIVTLKSFHLKACIDY